MGHLAVCSTRLSQLSTILVSELIAEPSDFFRAFQCLHLLSLDLLKVLDLALKSHLDGLIDQVHICFDPKTLLVIDLRPLFPLPPLSSVSSESSLTISIQQLSMIASSSLCLKNNFSIIKISSLTTVVSELQRLLINVCGCALNAWSSWILLICTISIKLRSTPSSPPFVVDLGLLAPDVQALRLVCLTHLS